MHACMSLPRPRKQGPLLFAENAINHSEGKQERKEELLITIQLAEPGLRKIGNVTSPWCSYFFPKYFSWMSRNIYYVTWLARSSGQVYLIL